jgi:hypothetical protein
LPREDDKLFTDEYNELNWDVRLTTFEDRLPTVVLSPLTDDDVANASNGRYPLMFESPVEEVGSAYAPVMDTPKFDPGPAVAGSAEIVTWLA